MIKKLIKILLPKYLIKIIFLIKSLYSWKQRSFLGRAPQFVKKNVLLNYGVKNAIWVETGTFFGSTTEFLIKEFPYVHSIEPSKDLYQSALEKFKGKNVTLYNDVSENVLDGILQSLNGNINFWLDGHYSAGVTFQGKKDCPVEDELKAIEKNINNFEKITILIDDVRCFLPSALNYSTYPSLDYLVDWARKYKMEWNIEHDIFIIQKK